MSGAVLHSLCEPVTLTRTVIRGYHTDVFISAPISSPSVDNCPRRSRRLLCTEGLI